MVELKKENLIDFGWRREKKGQKIFLQRKSDPIFISQQINS